VVGGREWSVGRIIGVRVWAEGVYASKELSYRTRNYRHFQSRLGYYVHLSEYYRL
jgi:hypothetical protein